MGGSGSGNHYHGWRSSKKTTVEACRQLDANRWMREGVLKAGVRHLGSWAWYSDAQRTQRTSAIGYEVNTVTDEPYVRLTYTFTERGQDIAYRIPLSVTRPRFGGLRWWFICPLSCRGRPCGRRVGKLYLPAGADYYGCRHCHNLTYASVQQHDKRVDALRRNPELVARLMQNLEHATLSDLGLLLKAADPRP
jgi:hypothetical protein